ncbi:MAG: peptidase C39 [Pirellulaceae bacterium]|nr:peptidase C39 [Pirellulaceae bacterium]
MTAIAVMSCLSVVAALVAGGLLYSDKGQRVILLLTLAVFATVYFLFYASGQLFWARLVPDSAAIIYTNFAAIFAGLAAGWAWRLPKTPAWRRGGLAVLLGGASLAAVCWPLLSIALRPPPAGGDQWQDGVALQTSWATCSPAAAATLFRAENIDVSERELIPLCLTDRSGTPTLGLYRGVKLIAQRHNRDVQIVDPDLDQLLSDNDWPVLLAVELPFGTEDRRYTEQWGWIPGMGHSVVAIGQTPEGGIIVGDPSVGLEIWSKADLNVLWQGNGMRVK